MKQFLTAFLLTCICGYGLAQTGDRIQELDNQLQRFALEYPEYSESIKLEMDATNVTLPNLLMGLSQVHQLNLSVGQDVVNINVVNNFTNVTVSELLLFLCKEYGLTIDFTGSILSVKKYNPPPQLPEIRDIGVQYSLSNDAISLDVDNAPLEKVFRRVMEASGKNLLYSNALRNQNLSLYLNNTSFDTAMEKLAAVNGLLHSKSRDGFYLFSASESQGNQGGNNSVGLQPGMYYEVLDSVNQMLNVNFNNASIANIIAALSVDLNLDVFTATPLEQAGTVTFNAKSILFDDLLTHLFESKQNASPISANTTNGASSRRGAAASTQPVSSQGKFTFKKENNIYFFGTADQLSLREVEIVQMMHRSVELLNDPSYYSGGLRTAGRTNQGSVNYFGNGPNSGGNSLQNQGLGQRRTINTGGSQFDNYQDGAEALVNILPEEIKSELDIKVDFELNSFLVSGPSAKVERFKSFIKQIDKPVPVVLIEVMIIEVRKSAIVETGISWGIGSEPTTTSGSIFPSADITLGANTVNKVIGGFDGFGSFNIGKVVPEFFATIKALEENGNIKIRSTPKLSTLNGHRANLSIGETTYYVITNQNFFGSQIPTTSEVRNYAPIDAELGVSIKPLVSGDGQVTLDINVIQSDFSGERIEEDAPPGLTSREFSSIIRMQNQDLAILGGLEEKLKNDSGTGVPFLARIPVIKWLFSKRKREDTKQKLTILIKPTVIY
ncbi:MAG: hypothetical protein AAFU57_12230 [Bacteroidota bacterium]